MNHGTEMASGRAALWWRSLEFNIGSWEEAGAALAGAFPPALVDHLDVGDDVTGVERDLVVVLCGGRSVKVLSPVSE